MAKINNLREIFILKLKVLYDIEEQLTGALPKMAEAATNSKLKEAFRVHLDETRAQAARLKQSLESLGEEAEGQEAAGIRGIIADAEWLIKQDPPAPLLDLLLADAARYAEHYEMAGYMVAISLADLLGEGAIRDQLTETLAEEETADDKLETLAESELNTAAEQAGIPEENEGLIDKIEDFLAGDDHKTNRDI